MFKGSENEVQHVFAPPVAVPRELSPDEYANPIPNSEHTPKYTKAKVLHTQDKQRVSWAA